MGEQAWANERKPSEGKREDDVKPKAEDDEDAFEALEAEQKEFLKVCRCIPSYLSCANSVVGC